MANGFQATALRNNMLLSILLCVAVPAYAVEVPNAADSGRISNKPVFPTPAVSPPDMATALPPEFSHLAPPEAQHLRIHLDTIILEGSTVLSDKEWDVIRKPYLHRDMPLSDVWQLAHTVTQYYRKRGYFLSVAIVPEQEITGNMVRLKMVEGHIARIHAPEPFSNTHTFRNMSRRLAAIRPLTLQALERELLLLQDIPGYKFEAVLHKADSGEESDGRVEMVLKSSVTPTWNGSAGINNHGSRYLGPLQATVATQLQPLPFHESFISGGASLPHREMKSVYASHTITLPNGWTAGGYTAYTNAVPGFSLKDSGIESDAITSGVEIAYPVIRQREQNLTVTFIAEMKNVDNNVQNESLSRDRIRATRFKAQYDNNDAWNGYNTLLLTLSKGIDAFGSNHRGDGDISRAAARPDFHKVELFLRRLQPVRNDWLVSLSTNAQMASSPLYSSEEFGYGGMGFGRAYDASEILGDHGIAGAIELSYLALPAFRKLESRPYVFVDGGKLWNRDAGQEKDASAFSLGIGSRFYWGASLSAETVLAFPVGHSVEAPQFQGGHAPRFLIGMQYRF